MSTFLEWSAFVLGMAIVVATVGSLMRTLILPRGQTSRFAVFVSRKLVWRSYIALANRFDDYETKDKILSYGAPTALVVLLLSWLLAFLVGYGLMLLPLMDSSWLNAVREAGSSMLTLGFQAHATPGATVIDFLAAVTGLIVIALQIAYLPTMYGAFQRREALVTMLQSRAGAPPWGPEILARVSLVNLTDELPQFYADWERWAAEVAESHVTYPVLIWFRSPHPLRNWVIGLLAVMDSAALQLALAPSKAPTQARLCLRMGFTCLRSIADVLGIRYDPDPLPEDPIELTYEEFLGGVHRLQETGFETERTPEEAWPHFRGWRVNYESLAYKFADLCVAPPGPWSGARSHLPGMMLVPQRPPNRQPGQSEGEQPKVERSGWHA